MPLSPQDRYWASHPRAVRALRTIADEPARTSEARKLADMGFIIDVPIMCWGWDPVTTMEIRKSQGFTWVPSAKQDPIRVMPGLSFPGLPSYDPANPPPGSIPVTMDWPPAPDMIAQQKPFQWRSRPSPNPADPDGVGSTWNPLDYMEVGAVYRDGEKRWEKTSTRAYYGYIVEWERVA